MAVAVVGADVGWRVLVRAALDACAARDLEACADAELAGDLGELASVARRVEALSARVVGEQVRRRPRDARDVQRDLKG